MYVACGSATRAAGVVSTSTVGLRRVGLRGFMANATRSCGIYGIRSGERCVAKTRQHSLLRREISAHFRRKASDDSNRRHHDPGSDVARVQVPDRPAYSRKLRETSA